MESNLSLKITHLYSSKPTFSVIRVFSTLAVLFDKIYNLSCLISRPLLFINFWSEQQTWQLPSQSSAIPIR